MSSSFFNFQINIFHIVHCSPRLSKHINFNRSANIPYKNAYKIAHVRPFPDRPRSKRANRRLDQTFGSMSNGTSERDKQARTHSIRHSVLRSNEPSPLRVCLSAQPHINTRKCRKLWGFSFISQRWGPLEPSVRASAYLYVCTESGFPSWVFKVNSLGKILPMSQFIGANRSLRVSVQPISAPEPD